jgi:hypothetical protein
MSAQAVYKLITLSIFLQISIRLSNTLIQAGHQTLTLSIESHPRQVGRMFKFINGVILFLYLLSHRCVATPINTTQGFTPYADNLCTSALDVASNSRNVLYNTLLADIHIMDYEYGNGHKYENVRFSQAKNSSNHSATFYTPHVYWKVPDPGAGCKLILLQGGGGDLVGPSQLNDLPGRIMLRASRAGCFYSPIRVSHLEGPNTFMIR